MTFIIIGADAAGMSAASRAKRNRPDLEVIVFEKTQDVSYSACGMPYNIAEPSREIEDLVVRKASVFKEKQGIELITGHTVTAIDPRKKEVGGISLTGKTFNENYDHLLIATGASPVVPEIPGNDLKGVMVLKTLADGRKIKAHIKENRVKKALIVGMGFIGLEMCEALRHLCIDVAMIKPGPHFLPWMEKSLAEEIKTEIVSQDIQLYLGNSGDISFNSSLTTM